MGADVNEGAAMSRKQDFMNKIKRGLREQAQERNEPVFVGQEFATISQLAPVFGYSTKSGYFKKQWLEPIEPVGDRYCIEDIADAYIQGIVPVNKGRRGTAKMKGA